MFLKKNEGQSGGQELLGDFIATVPNKQPIVLIKEPDKERIPWELLDSTKIKGLLSIEFKEKLNRDFSFEGVITDWSDAIENYNQKIIPYRESLWSDNFRTLNMIVLLENSLLPIVDDIFQVFSPAIADKGIQVITRQDFLKRIKENLIPSIAEYNSPFKPKKSGTREINFQNRVPRMGVRLANFQDNSKKKLPLETLVENKTLNLVGFVLELAKIYRNTYLIPRWASQGTQLIFPINSELVRNIKLIQKSKIRNRFYPLENLDIVVERILAYEDFINSYEEIQQEFIQKVIKLNQENLTQKLKYKSKIPEKLEKNRNIRIPFNELGNQFQNLYDFYPFENQIKDLIPQRYYWLRWNYLGTLPYFQIRAGEDPNILKLQVRRERIIQEKQLNQKKEKFLLEEELIALGIKEQLSPAFLFKKQEQAKKENIPLKSALTEKEYQKVETYLQQIRQYLETKEINLCPHFAIRKRVDFDIIWDERYGALEKLLQKYGQSPPDKATQKIHCCNCGFVLACQHEKLLLEAWKARDKEKEINELLEKNYYEVEGGSDNTDKFIHCRYCGRKIKDLNLENEIQFEEDGRRRVGAIVERERDYLTQLDSEIERALIFNRFQGKLRNIEILREIESDLDYDIQNKVINRRDLTQQKKKLIQKAYIVAYIYAFLFYRVLRSNFRLNFDNNFYKGKEYPKSIENFGIVFLRILRAFDPFFLSQLQLEDIKIGPILTSAYKNISSFGGEIDEVKKGQYKPYILRNLVILKSSHPKEKGSGILEKQAWLVKQKLAYYYRIFKDKFTSDEVWKILTTLEGSNLEQLNYEWNKLEKLISKVRIFPDKPMGFLEVPEKLFSFNQHNYFHNGAKRKNRDLILILKNQKTGAKLEINSKKLDDILKEQTKEFNSGYPISNQQPINLFNSPEWLRIKPENLKEETIKELTLPERIDLRERVIHYQNSEQIRTLIESACSGNNIIYFPEANFVCGASETDERVSQKLIDTFLKLILFRPIEEKPLPQFEYLKFESKVEVKKLEINNISFPQELVKKILNKEISDILTQLSIFPREKKDDTKKYYFSLIANPSQLRGLSQIDFVQSIGRQIGTLSPIVWANLRNDRNLTLREKLIGSINLLAEALRKVSKNSTERALIILKEGINNFDFYQQKNKAYQEFEELRELTNRKRFDLFQKLTPEQKIEKGLFLADFRENQDLFGRLDDELNLEENKINIDNYEEPDEIERDVESMADDDDAFLATDLDFF